MDGFRFFLVGFSFFYGFGGSYTLVGCRLFLVGFCCVSFGIGVVLVYSSIVFLRCLVVLIFFGLGLGVL